MWIATVFAQCNFSVWGSSLGSYIIFSCHVSLVSFHLWQFPSLFLSFMTITLGKNNGQLFCSVSLSLDLSALFCFFSPLDWNYAVMRRMPQRRCDHVSSLHHIRDMSMMSVCATGDDNCGHLAEKSPAWIFRCKLTIFPFVLSKYVGKDTLRVCLNSRLSFNQNSSNQHCQATGKRTYHDSARCLRPS